MFLEFDQILELGQSLYKGFLELDEREFLRQLREVAESISQSCSEIKTLDGRFMTLNNGLLKSIYMGETDAILRQGAILSSGFLAVPEPERKIEAVIRDVQCFLTTFRDTCSQRAFSELILLHLRSRPMEAFRAFTVEDLADQFGYHPAYLSKKFSRERGFSLHKAILHEKFRRAMSMFRDPERPSVKAVASSLGYSSSTYFSRLFRARFGMLPTEVPVRFEPSEPLFG